MAAAVPQIFRIIFNVPRVYLVPELNDPQKISSQLARLARRWHPDKVKEEEHDQANVFRCFIQIHKMGSGKFGISRMLPMTPLLSG